MNLTVEMKFFKVWLISSLCLTSNVAAAVNGLCHKEEKAYFSCIIVNKKWISVCGSKDLKDSKSYVQYRFGKENKIELEFPQNKKNSLKEFELSRYTRPKVTLLRLRFKSGGIVYSVFEDSNAENGENQVIGGVEVSEKQITCIAKPLIQNLVDLEGFVRNYDFLVK